MLLLWQGLICGLASSYTLMVFAAILEACWGPATAGFPVIAEESSTQKEEINKICF